jgi:hypothetical protein
MNHLEDLIQISFFFGLDNIYKIKNMGTKRFLVTEEEKKNIISLYSYKGILQEQKNLMNEGDIDWGEVMNDALIGSIIPGPGTLIGASYSLIKQWYNSGGSRSAVRRLLDGCNKNKGIGKSTINDRTLNVLVTDLYDAMEENNAIGLPKTDEVKIKRSLSGLSTIPDVCKAEKMYKQNYPGSTLFGDLDGDIDDNDEWNEFVWQPLAQSFRNSMAENEKNFKDRLKKEKEKKSQKLAKNAKECGYFSDEDYRKANWKCPSQVLINAKKCGWKTIDEYKLQDWACPGATPQEKEIIKKETQRIIYRDRDQGGGGMKYRDCTETYVKGCKSETIKKVQGCLGIGADGKMGNKTVSAVSAKIGRSYFTDGDVEKLCGGATNQEKKKSEFDYEIPTSDNQEPKKDVNTSSDFGGEEY